MTLPEPGGGGGGPARGGEVAHRLFVRVTAKSRTRETEEAPDSDATEEAPDPDPTRRLAPSRRYHKLQVAAILGQHDPDTLPFGQASPSPSLPPSLRPSLPPALPSLPARLPPPPLLSHRSLARYSLKYSVHPPKIY